MELTGRVPVSRRGWLRPRRPRSGRLGTATDVAEAVRGQASDRTGFMTGKTLSIPGDANLRVRRD
jgi:NAD(P)-dependent dehydrogenase (short-subunit alcohol dehydrogenase family)